MIRQVIKEDVNMRDRLSPEVMPKNAVEKANKKIRPTDEEIDRVNEIIELTMPMTSGRDDRIAAFNAEFGLGSLDRVCKVLGIDDIYSYDGDQYSM
jgi:hypothetical protein